MIIYCLGYEIYCSETRILTQRQVNIYGTRMRQAASDPERGDHMSAILTVRHNVQDYAAWRKVYDEVEPLRAQYGCTDQRVTRLPDDGNDLFVTHDFPTFEQAEGFAHDPALREAMGRAGVEGAPRIEIFTDV